MFTGELDKFRIILGSKSPRRQELLRELGLKFDISVRKWEEQYPAHLKAEEIALYVAGEKAEVFRRELKDNEIVITADTIVWCDGRVLDKPVDLQDAERIINVISGNTHEVITAVCLLSLKKKVTFFSSTKVTFEELTGEEISFYVRNYAPYDKAGAYGIQEWIGLAACSRIEGSYFNVMGLPVHQVYTELKKFIII